MAMADKGVGTDGPALAAAVEAVGRWWAEAPYFAEAERHTDEQWRELILPFLCLFESGVDCAVVVELGAGRGRTASKLLPLAGRLHLVDLHPNNLEACRRRFGADQRLSCHVTDGRSLPLPDATATFLFSFDSKVHFDSDVVRAYLREARRALRPGGHAFLHHSNTVAHPGGDFRAQRHWRNFMSKELLAHYALKEGLEVVRQEPVDWAGDGASSTAFAAPAPRLKAGAGVERLGDARRRSVTFHACKELAERCLRRSVRLDANGAHQFDPALRLAPEPRRDGGGVRVADEGAGVLGAAAHGVLRQHGAQFAREAVEHRLRRAGGRVKGVPDVHGKSSKPNSARQGTSGSAGWRSRPVVASGRRRPSRRKGSTGGGEFM
jgi:SAM-dependent methyltransferase